MKKFFFAIVLIANLVGRLFAGNEIPGTFDWSAPTVPAEVAAQGRQSIMSYLVGQVDNVDITFQGKSVLSGTANYIHLSREALRSRGYIDDGSYSQLRTAIASTARYLEIAELPDGGYDVGAHIILRTASYTRALEGWTSFDYSRDSGGMLEGRARAYVGLPYYVNVSVSGYVVEARWIPSGYGDYRNLEARYVEKDEKSLIQVSLQQIDNGVVAFSGSGTVRLIDFKDNKVKFGTDAIFRIIGLNSSGDIVPYVPSGDKNALSSFCSDVANFYRSVGKFYGRFPVVDIDTSVKIDETLDFSVKVWGAPEGTRRAPKNIRVRVIRTLDGSISPGVYQPILMKGGGWLIQLPPGTYQIFTDFEELQDPTQDMNPERG